MSPDEERGTHWHGAILDPEKRFTRLFWMGSLTRLGHMENGRIRRLPWRLKRKGRRS